MNKSGLSYDSTQLLVFSNLFNTEQGKVTCYCYRYHHFDSALSSPSLQSAFQERRRNLSRLTIEPGAFYLPSQLEAVKIAMFPRRFYIFFDRFEHQITAAFLRFSVAHFSITCISCRASILVILIPFVVST